MFSIRTAKNIQNINKLQVFLYKSVASLDSFYLPLLTNICVLVTFILKELHLLCRLMAYTKVDH